MMKTYSRLLFTLLLVFQSASPAPAQQPRPSPSPAPSSQPTQQTQQQPPPRPLDVPTEEVDEDDVVKITTNLVQVDAVVTDKKGRQVTDLKAEDFEVFEDGRRQQITNFSYVSIESPAEVAAAPTPKPDRNAPPAPPAPPRNLRPEQVRRTFALVVDDLGLSFESTALVRRALRDFVDKQMRPNDLVAIVRTSAGVGALQQFTSDRRQLYAAIERVRWYPTGRGGVGAFAPIERGPTPVGAQGTGQGGEETGVETAAAVAEFEDFRQEYFAVGTLGALRFVVRGMNDLPGRKSVILFSDGFSLYTPDRNGRGRSDRVLVALRGLVDLANRASVTFYTMDARGLVYTGFTAADDTSGLTPQELTDAQNERSQQLFDTQSGLQYLAEETGGFSSRNTNALPVARVLEDQRGYYLIGYRPESQIFDRRFHRITARLKGRSDLRLRSRKGFYGYTDAPNRDVARTPEQQLYRALMSPFSSGGVGVRLAGVFTATDTPQPVPYIAAAMHLDARDLKFVKAPDGKYQTKIEIVGVTFSDTGVVVDNRGVSQVLTLTEEAYGRVQREGIGYTVNVPVKKPGAYQLRVAVRDAESARVGSASQFIEVPDLKKNRLTLSGLVVSGSNPSGDSQGAAAARSAVAGGEGLGETRDPEATPAVRRFRQRQNLNFAYVVFNARADKATAKPQLTVRLRLFRDGQVVYEGGDNVVPLADQQSARRIISGGRLTLGTDLKPGEYVLQIAVTDQLREPKDKYRQATQWIDFEVVK